MSAVTGTLTDPAMRSTASSIRSRGMRSPSGYPREKATPALVVAIAGAPESSRIRAVAQSQMLASTRGSPLRCSPRRISALLLSDSRSCMGLAPRLAQEVLDRRREALVGHPIGQIRGDVSGAVDEDERGRGGASITHHPVV